MKLVIKDEKILATHEDSQDIESLYDDCTIVKVDIFSGEIGDDYEITEEMREAKFNKDFFLTSLGYVRRKAYIQGTGETKDFLSDCFPVLCNAFSLGQSIRAIIYNKPPMTEDVSDWIQYQKTDIEWTSTEQQTFLAECLAQYQADFFGS